MGKVLIIVLLVVWAFIRFSRFLFGPLQQSSQGSYQRTQGQPNRDQDRQPRDGNVNIDFIPEDKKRKRKDANGLGEYVDYEEVD